MTGWEVIGIIVVLFIVIGFRPICETLSGISGSDRCEYACFCSLSKISRLPPTAPPLTLSLSHWERERRRNGHARTPSPVGKGRGEGFEPLIKPSKSA